MMVRSSALISLMLLVAVGPAASFLLKSQANPMRKIINMLQDMSKEIEREGEVEKEIFDKALCACEGGDKELKKVIDDSNADIEEFTSKIAGDTAEKAQLTQDVADHKTNAAAAEKDLSEATMLREKDHKKFVAEEKDTKLNIANLGKAIPAIEKGMGGGAALMQMSNAPKFQRFVEVTKLLNSDDRTAVLAFLDAGDQGSMGSAVQSKGAGEILGILKNMHDEMNADLKELQGQETQDLTSFDELKAAKTQEININKKSVIEKEKRMGELALSLSEGKHALKDAQEELANAEKFLANMKEQCATMEKTRDERAKMRAAEVKAISQAVGILNDDDALDVFKASKGAAALVQKPIRKTYDALLQLSSRNDDINAVKPRTSGLLSLKHNIIVEDGKEVDLSEHQDGHSTNMAGEAEKLVVGMVDGMVGVLHDEDVGDEHKKAWCANETTVAHGLEAQKKETIEKTTAEISQQEDQLATLTAEIKGLGEKIAETDKMVHESTENRKAEHQEFVDSFATSATAIRLIDRAILKLEEFYSPEKVAKKKAAVKAAAMKEAGLALLHTGSAGTQRMVKEKENSLLPGGFDAFIQVQSGSKTFVSLRQAVRHGVDPIAIPETPTGAYEKQESGGVIGLMNDFKTDLKLDMTESETEEKFAAKEYVRIMTDAQETRAQDLKSRNEKMAAKATLDEKLVSNKALLELSEEELHNLELYLVQLHTECDFLLQNFEARHESRVEGEGGLESAETIVTGAEPPSHREIENRFEDEHTDDDVDHNFPGTPIDDGPDLPKATR